MLKNKLQLLDELKALEIELHNTTTRKNVERLNELLHDSFCELGRSGLSYTKSDILARLPLEAESTVIFAEQFQLRQLSEHVALLTYRSAHKALDGTLQRHSLRSSIWQYSAKGWQMSFHQGTPTENF